VCTVSAARTATPPTDAYRPLTPGRYFGVSSHRGRRSSPPPIIFLVSLAPLYPPARLRVRAFPSPSSHWVSYHLLLFLLLFFP